ncbi:MAG: hypothetical protein EYC71_11195 [Gammaproteobacteria bacterium]|nr:MAG: hypothetical protein EYC71_11195 [Gammaproteobacteria bacterium]
MRALILVAGLLVAGVTQAAADIPAQLEAWRSWVQKGEEFRRCTLIANTSASSADEFACIWPGVLTINADTHGANLSQDWNVEIEAWVPLPFDEEHWPQEATVDGKPAVILNRDGPQVWMEPGEHVLRARLEWSERPQALQVPEVIGVVRLVVDGKTVAPLQRSGDQLTLGRGKVAATEADSLDVRIFRRYVDQIPGELTTRIRMEVSGQAREEVLGPVLPDGFIAVSLDNEERPARLDDAGMLHVQVRPGTNTVTLAARATEPLDKLVARLPEANRVDQEIWSYQSNPFLRVTAIEGAIQVDPAQANVPEEWRNLPAFALDNGGTLTIEQRSRGLDANASNRLSLQREAWLDFSGDGWFARDSINGSMQSGWRMDLAAPYTLQRAQSASGGSDALLITQGSAPGSSGVEWRNPQVDLRAGVRINGSAGRLPVTGWNQTFDSAAIALHLPYGYRLIAAPGADQASGSWLSRWTLLDVFLAAIISLLAFRLLGMLGGMAASAYLVLAYQEAGAPLWTLLLVLALSALVRALPKGRLATAGNWMRVAALIVLAVFALPFAADQVRYALYPQLESSHTPASFQFGNDMNVANMPMQAASPAPVPEAADMNQAAQEPERSAEKLESIMVTGSSIGRVDMKAASPKVAIQRARINNRYSKSTVVQTGAGEPGWQLGNRYQLTWSGPVLADQSVRLLIASPWLVRLLRVVLVAVLGILLWQLLRNRSGGGALLSRYAKAGSVLMLVSLAGVSQAQAQTFPPQEMLQDLKALLTKPPECAPSCASIANASVSANGDALRVAMEVHAQARVSVAIPMDDKSLVLESISIDGVADAKLASISGATSIAVDRGVHRVEIRYTVGSDRVELAFPEQPRRILFEGSNWLSSGIVEDRMLTETLSLTRSREAGDAAAENVEQRFPPYVRVHRTINLDLDWSIDGTVERLAPDAGGFTVSMAVLAGEHVQTPGLKVQDGKLTLAIADGEDSASWTSTFDQVSSFSLVAPELGTQAEVWRIAVGPTWHVEFAGLPETPNPSANNQPDYHVFEFHPLPGETLTMKVQKPNPSTGAIRAIDSLNLASAVGPRSRVHSLTMDMRASQGGEQAISLPAGVELLGVSRNGEALGLRLLESKLSLPLNPGAQKFEIRFQDNQPAASRVSTPLVDPGLPAANVGLSIDVPNDRWLLAAFGPAAGPAVLFWGELVVAIVLAWLLSRWRTGSLRFHHYLLLVLGFSTFSWIALLVVLAWLFAMEWRSRHVIGRNWKFNLAQLGLAALSLVALLVLFGSIQNGLLGSPDMVIRGEGSWGQHLQWFADRSDGVIPEASVISLPLWIYNLVMLVWSLWLAWAVVGWARKGFAAWMQGGYWQPWSEAKPIEIDTPPAPPPAV